MMKSITEMYCQEPLESEKYRIESMDSFDFDIDKPTRIKVYYKGINVGELIMSCKSIDFKPTDKTMDIDVVLRNLNPVTK